MEGCLTCSRIENIKRSTNPFSVAKLKTGYIVLGKSQPKFIEGYTLFLSERHVTRPYELGESMPRHMKEVGLVEEALYRAFKPRVVNVKHEGNSEKHLHWYMYPRYDNDPYLNETVEVAHLKILLKTGKDTSKEKPNRAQLHEYKNKLQQALNSLVKPVKMF